ncbi:hypothetical protein [Salana multivorans]
MGALRKTMEYLGLSEPDVDHELDYPAEVEEKLRARRGRGAAGEPRGLLAPRAGDADQRRPLREPRRPAPDRDRAPAHLQRRQGDR